MKYKLYKYENKKKVLIAVEYAETIYEATDDLIRDVIEDMQEDEQYKGCEVTAYAPRPEGEHKYFMLGIVMPPHANKNISLSYHVTEEDEKEFV